jgi:hypothetical protein
MVDVAVKRARDEVALLGPLSDAGLQRLEAAALAGEDWCPNYTDYLRLITRAKKARI